MIVIPAIDLRDGRVVRLRQGRADDQTVYADDPAAIARRWAGCGAEWIHLVDLDGAFAGRPANLEAIRAVIGAVDVPCEVGGGLRDVGSAAKLLSLGVARVIFGTVAVTSPEVVRRAIERFGSDRIVVGIDARNGKVAVSGWTETSEMPAVELANHMKLLGVKRVIYTDIHRDGMFTGPNVEAAVELARKSGLRVIASGGVGSVADVARLAAHEPEGIEGVIIGKALYDGTVKLEEAVRAAAASDSV